MVEIKKKIVAISNLNLLNWFGLFICALSVSVYRTWTGQQVILLVQMCTNKKSLNLSGVMYMYLVLYMYVLTKQRTLVSETDVCQYQTSVTSSTQCNLIFWSKTYNWLYILFQVQYSMQSPIEMVHQFLMLFQLVWFCYDKVPSQS